MPRLGGYLQLQLALLLLATAVVVAVAVRPLAASAPAPMASAASEVEIMLQLRQVLHASHPEWAARVVTWRLGNPDHPCRWQHVTCDSQQHITSIYWGNVMEGSDLRPNVSIDPNVYIPLSHRPAPLLPQLASLPWLKKLDMAGEGYKLAGGIPEEWGLSGAFPRLEELSVKAYDVPDGLPDIHPDALPSLRHLRIVFRKLHATLPASWGASSPPVFAGLQTLGVLFHVVGGLPSAWAHGFPTLESLSLGHEWDQPLAMVPGSASTQQSSVIAQPAPLPAPTPASLPPDWAWGFPRLVQLFLAGVELSGGIPATWLLPGSFPALARLYLINLNLSGTLPEQIFTVHPNVISLQLLGNHFSGPLPGSWADSKVSVLQLASNQLTGPAFPPAWLLPGAMPQMRFYTLENNPELTGTLPEGLAWPNLDVLRLRGTAVSGGIPSSWCTAPFADKLYSVTPLNFSAPPCAAKALHFSMGREAVPTWPTLRLSVPAVALPAMLGLLVTVCTTGGWPWLRRRWRQPMRLPIDGSPLIQTGGGSSRSTTSSSGGTSTVQQLAQLVGIGETGVPGPAGPAGIGQLDASQRRQRLSGLVAAVASGQHGLDLIPMQCMPETVAHRLGPLHSTRGWPNRHMGRTVGGKLSSAQPSGIVTAVEGQGQGQQHMAAAAAAEQDPLLPRQVTTGSSEAYQAGASRARKWGLETESIRLAPDDLQFVRGADGRLTELGRGTYGDVFLAKLLGVDVAVKAFELLPSMDSGVIWREASLLRQCVHEGIVPLYGLVHKGSLVLMAMKLMRGGSLHDMLRNQDRKHKLRWSARGQQVALDVAAALDYLHTQLHVLHSDLKPSNVLLTEDCRAALADLGVAQVMASTAKPAVGGTHLFAAPEQLLGQRCTLAADMYAFGLLLMELLTQTPCHKRGMWTLPTAPRDCPQDVVDLIETCLSPEPHQRPRAAQALQCLQRASSCTSRERDGSSAAAAATQLANTEEG